MAIDESVAEPDLVLAALFVGSALNDEMLERLAEAGHSKLRFHHRVLFQHLLDGERSIGELAEALGVTQQAVSKTVSELESLGYLERRPGRDARVRLVALTSVAEDALRDAKAARAEIVAELREELGADRVDGATELLLDVLRARDAVPPSIGRRVPAR
jgi:DNA-binding MarR family transcriptional regulator